MKTLLSFKKKLFAGICLFTLQACGNQSYITEHVQDFRIFPETNDSLVLESLNILTDEYNDDIGFEAITLVTEKNDANSFIRFPLGLRSNENKLGLGQWITVTTEEGREILPSSRILTRSVLYAMEIDFDYQNFRDKAERVRNENDEKAWSHLYHLFCHEVGHGLQMNHNESKASIMYPSIPENSRPNLGYDQYFSEARRFFERSMANAQ
ncbi:MAG: matrixin family metalloprotease [Oligoflexus sp.]